MSKRQYGWQLPFLTLTLVTLLPATTNLNTISSLLQILLPRMQRTTGQAYNGSLSCRTPRFVYGDVYVRAPHPMQHNSLESLGDFLNFIQHQQLDNLSQFPLRFYLHLLIIYSSQKNG